MSWDVMIFNIRRSPPPPFEKLEEVDLQPIGRADEVRRNIAAALPGVDWRDPTWGLYDGDGFSIEFNVGQDDPIQNMMLHVRGGGDAVSAIVTMLRADPGWAALDCSTGQFLDPKSPSDEGWRGFQAFRDKIVLRSRKEDNK
jgi:hypothetical protein